MGVKFTDDYDAKYKIWAMDPKPQPIVPLPKMPKFKSRRFSSYEEYEEFRKQLIQRLAVEGPPND